MLTNHDFAPRRVFFTFALGTATLFGGGCLQEPASSDLDLAASRGAMSTLRGDDGRDEGLFCDLCAAQGCDCAEGQCVDCESLATPEAEEAEGLFCDLCAFQGCDCDGAQCVNCEGGTLKTPEPGEAEGLFCDLCSFQGCDCTGDQCVNCDVDSLASPTSSRD